MILAGNNLNFSYSDTLVVSDFSIKLERGKIFMLSGPNGSGKSTIIKLICGLLKPDSGNITINGEDLNSFSDLERAKKIGVVAQTQLPILDFTVEEVDELIKKLNEKEEPIVFILWGNFAKSKIKYITNPKHLVLSSAHPSPFSVRQGFFGSKPFSKTNEFLKKHNIKEIEW